MNYEYIRDRLERPVFTAEQIKALTSPIGEDQIEIKPDGVVYCPADIIRLRLNQALGLGQWVVCTDHHTVIGDKYNEEVQVPGELWIFGKFISSAIGEYSGKGSMSFTNKIEAARSDLLTKLVKNLSISGELWNKGFIESWKEKFCRNVYCYTGKTNDKGEKEIKKLWIRKDRKFVWPIEEVVSGKTEQAPPPKQESPKTLKQESESAEAGVKIEFGSYASAEQIKEFFKDRDAFKIKYFAEINKNHEGKYIFEEIGSYAKRQGK